MVKRVQKNIKAGEIKCLDKEIVITACNSWRWACRSRGGHLLTLLWYSISNSIDLA